jgi:hypothetical protein
VEILQEAFIRHVVQGSSRCEQQFFVRHSSQWKRRRSWSSKEWSESQTVIYCELSYLIVILKKCQQTQSSNPEPIIISHGDLVYVTIVKKMKPTTTASSYILVGSIPNHHVLTQALLQLQASNLIFLRVNAGMNPFKQTKTDPEQFI